jgi:hypothetical protein
VSPTFLLGLDRFDQLSGELILEIFSYTTDFVEVECLSVVSPWVRAIFDRHARSIFVNLIDRNLMVMISGIQELYRGNALIHSRPYAATDFRKYVLTCSSQIEYPTTYTSGADITQLFRTPTCIQHLQ